MSDAITLDVLSSSPVQLDVGDADPIAREEIAALATRVTTAEGDISALDGRMDTVEGDISTLGTTVDGIDARVEAIEADYMTAEDVMGALGGEAPALVAGSSCAILGDPETASWMERTTAADGAALIEAVYGRTLVWNQLVKTINGTTQALTGVTRTITDGVVVMNGTAAEASASRYVNVAGTTFNIINGHKYLVNLHNGSLNYYVNVSGAYSTAPTPRIFTATENQASGQVILIVPASEYTFDNATFIPQLFDLTTMFGVGNEPATVAEFEALYPLPYYPYDPGSLLPVRMEGIETVGFNLFDKNNLNRINGYIDNGSIVSNPNHATVYIPCLPNMTYCASRRAVSTNERFAIGWTAETPAAGVSVYGVSSASTSQVVGNNMVLTTTTGADARYIVLWACAADLASAALELLCINISDPARNGEYEPHWSSERAIPAATYFPDGMRSAGSVYDELRADAAVTRVGAVDLGTLTWSKNDKYWYNQSLVNVMKMNGYNEVSPLTSENYASITASEAVNEVKTGIANHTSALGGLIVYTGDLTNAPSGLLFYALATPTTQTIDQPLPLSYRVGAGGTERVMVASGTTSAPPIFVTRYPLDPADLAASIAPRESATAEANHAVGDLIMLGFTLCKVTTAIARGEAITIGTNVTRTSVAAEIAALS